MSKREPKMDSYIFLKYAKLAVAKYLRSKGQDVKLSDIYHVSTDYSLGHQKGMFSGPNSDGYYFEVTYNYDKNVMYVDAYKKENNSELYPIQMNLDLEWA